jgi:tRNA G37 N-methylase Trm5
MHGLKNRHAASLLKRIRDVVDEARTPKIFEHIRNATKLTVLKEQATRYRFHFSLTVCPETI